MFWDVTLVTDAPNANLVSARAGTISNLRYIKTRIS